MIVYVGSGAIQPYINEFYPMHRPLTVLRSYGLTLLRLCLCKYIIDDIVCINVGASEMALRAAGVSV